MGRPSKRYCTCGRVVEVWDVQTSVPGTKAVSIALCSVCDRIGSPSKGDK